jgi:hypothetical protein
MFSFRSAQNFRRGSEFARQPIEEHTERGWHAVCYGLGRRLDQVLGWMILFALLTLPGAAAAIAGYPVAMSVKTSSLLFALLFLFALSTQAIRGRSR